MQKEMKIKKINAREILDSRGNPTIEVEVILEDGNIGIAKVPSGASTGSFEKLELRDKNEKRYGGKGVLIAVENVIHVIAPKLIGMNALNQRKIDYTLIELDGTENKSKLGANSILGVSMAVSRAAANHLKLELYQYLGGVFGNQMPTVMMNILNGGKHSENSVNIQEFMIVPSASTTSDSVRMCSEVYHTLKKVLKDKGYSTALGDEGGFAPDLKEDEEAIKLIKEAVEKAGYILGVDFKIALDVAATEMLEEAKKKNLNGYYFWKTDKIYSVDELISYYEELISKYPIYSIEDPLGEEDVEGWIKITEKLKDKVQIVGDDLFVTNKKRLEKGISEKMANSILIKPNQIGTITETLETIQKAKESGYKVIISHRSGETEDTYIADLAVATSAMQIKAGAPARTDRICKYNRLMYIEEKIQE